MADSSTNNIRKNSLPSTCHPLLITTEQNLLRVIESFHGTFPSTNLSLSHQFSCLKALYESLGDALHLQVHQKDLACERGGGIKGAELEQILDGSIMVLDMCGGIKDCYTRLKDGLKEIESSMRRKGVECDIGGYIITSKKMLHKMVSKCFKEMKKIKKDYGNVLQKDDSAMHDSLVHLLKSVQHVTFEVLQCSLCFISHTNANRSKVSGWSLVSKFLKAKKVSGEEEIEGDLVEKIDFGLSQLMHNKKSSNSMMKIQNVLKNMKLLELRIEELEQELECLFRLLLRNRVFLLNNVNSYV